MSQKRILLTSILFSIFVLVVAAAVAWRQGWLQQWFFAPTEIVRSQDVSSEVRMVSPVPTSLEEPSESEESDQVEMLEMIDLSSIEASVVAEELNVPWEIAFLPDGTYLVTERPGQLVHIYPDRRERIEVIGVEQVGEGGLLGLALAPDFENSGHIYLYQTTQAEDGLTNRVVRYRFENDSLSQEEIIIQNIPGAQYHDGGRIAFGPDGKLYVTTGDAGETALAQDVNSVAGKILRLNPDGSIPEDNPFGADNPVYSYGHRNPQGLAWTDSGELWITEHGPSGVRSGYDEVNRVEAGANYGWPDFVGAEAGDGFIEPYVQSGADETWAPAGAEIIGDQMLFVGLRGQAVYSVELPAPDTALEQLSEIQPRPEVLAYFRERWGRLRVVRQGPDRALYILTSNVDGRGNPQPGDDKIIRLQQ